MPWPREEPPTPTTDREGADELTSAIDSIDGCLEEISDVNSDPAGYDFSDFKKMAEAVLSDWRDAVEQQKEETRVIR